MFHSRCWSAFSAAAVVALAGVAGAQVKFQETGAPFFNPIGVAYHSGLRSLIVTSNYPSGSPYSFSRIDEFGGTTQWSSAAGLSDEVYLDIPRSPAGGWTPDEAYSGNGRPGQILKISADGLTVTPNWITLPGETGLFRGQLRFDRAGTFGNDLIATTTSGNVWRINSAGTPTLLANLGRGGDFEGLVTIPNDVSRYGPLAGKIVVGDEASTNLWTVDAAGTVSVLNNVAPPIEGLHIVPANERFVGVDYADGRILYTEYGQFDPFVGDLLVVSETYATGSSGLTRLLWNGTSFDQAPVTLTADSFIPHQWEGSTFAPISVPAPGVAAIAAVAGLRRRRR